MTNRERAVAGGTALSTFTRDTYGGREVTELHPDDVYTAAYDLICDLGHFIRLYAREQRVNDPGNWTLENIVAAAERHYDFEREFGWDEEVPA